MINEIQAKKEVCYNYDPCRQINELSMKNSKINIIGHELWSIAGNKPKVDFKINFYHKFINYKFYHYYFV